MTFKPGDKKPANSGRGKGVQNKSTVAVKEVLRAAMEAAGNEIDPEGEGGAFAYLRKQALDEPKTFMAGVFKLIPQEVVGNLNIEHKLEIVDLSDKGSK